MALFYFLVYGLLQWAKKPNFTYFKSTNFNIFKFSWNWHSCTVYKHVHWAQFLLCLENFIRAGIKKEKNQLSSKSKPIKCIKLLKLSGRFTHSKPQSKMVRTKRKACEFIPISPTSYLFYDILHLAIVLRYVNWYTKHHLLEREKNDQSYQVSETTFKRFFFF